MSEASNQRSEEFLKVSSQFKLGALTTESSHPVTADLSEVARRDIAQALDLLFQVDADVLAKYREFAESGRAGRIKETLLHALNNGGRVFFTGCGATGRLSIQLASIWREFWRRQKEQGHDPAIESRAENSGRAHGAGMLREPAGKDACATDASATAERSRPALDWENRVFSVMAGGDYALIKSVEGFEDFAAFGKKQLGDLGVSSRDVVFAITEGGETSFVIGTAWKGVEAGAKVYFVYNNPDAVLCRHVERSREVIEDDRIEKINLTTGPMAITGSTRMQATTIQLCVMLTVLEMVVRDLMRLQGRARHSVRAVGKNQDPSVTNRGAQGTDAPYPAATSPLSALEGEGEETDPTSGDSASVPREFLRALTEMHATLRSPVILSQLAGLVALEESVYRAGGKNNYYADGFGLDVLTDTTERSPTYCTPPFRKFDDAAAAESWSFLFVPRAETAQAWEHILKQPPRCIEWSEREVRELAGEDTFARTLETIRKIRRAELLRFKIGLDGLAHRSLTAGDSAIGILSGREQEALLSPAGFYRVQLEAAHQAGAKVGLICFGDAESLKQLGGVLENEPWWGERPREPSAGLKSRLAGTLAPPLLVPVPVPESGLLLDGVTRVGLKMLLNALSTCTMVRLGRVMGNYMIWVVASNLKLVDRATRYIQRLTGLSYEAANRLLFEVIEHVEPRMKADRAYPPVVGLAVLRARHHLTNEEAERRLQSEI